MAMQDRRSGTGWLALSDDDLIDRVENLQPGHGQDQALLDVVGSRRHFFVRQLAARKIEDAKLLHEHWDDRQVGQILVRGLSRVEDLQYLERLRTESRHERVRRAAEVELKAIAAKSY
jgi:hypothetical protein